MGLTVHSHKVKTDEACGEGGSVLLASSLNSAGLVLYQEILCQPFIQIPHPFPKNLGVEGRELAVSMKTKEILLWGN